MPPRLRPGADCCTRRAGVPRAPGHADSHREFCRATGQTVPDSVEMMARCIRRACTLLPARSEQFGRVLGQRL